MNPTITFKNRDDFNEVSGWIFAPGDVIDIGYSDMIVIFKDNKTLREWEGCILWNNIREEIKTIGLEHLNQHKEDLESSIRLGDSLIEEALSDYNSYLARYNAAKSFLEQYNIIK